MDAVILCAGKGERISHAINRMQKCMIRVYEKPIIHHMLEYFESVGIGTVYFVIGYRGDEIKDYFRGKEKNTKIRFVEDPGFEIDSTSRSLSLVEQYINQDFIYSQGEIIYNKSLIEELYNRDLKEKSAVIALSRNLLVAPTHPRVAVSNDQIDDICFNPTKDENKYIFSYIGVNKLCKDFFQFLKTENKVSDAMRKMLKSDKKVGYVIYNDEWKHFATVEDLVHLTD